MNKLLFLLITLLFLIPQINYSQEKKPKVVLVLSGGGAKGVAHIPLLQAIDSLGIVPDLVIGTSMGSIVGGLYAMGYSGDSIATIAKNLDWDEVLGGSIALRDVSAEEKSEYKRYLIDFDLVKGKPKMSSSILNDQNLRELLSLLTFPVFDIRDFDDLPIPFRAMTTDIVNGKELLLGDGPLSVAMRASMSIPGVFNPVRYDGTLLIDGGVLNNFPVDVAQKMDADFIIGSDVGGGMAPKEKLNSMTGLIFQAAMLTSNLKNVKSRADCDILIDHMPYLTYSTGDFGKATEIFEEGKTATNINMDALAALAEKLKKFKQRRFYLPVARDSIILDTIVYKNISEANLDLVKARANIKTHTKYNPVDVIDDVNRAMGTTLFNEIIYSGGVNKDGKIELDIDAQEHAQNQLKGSLHYDTNRGVGLIINYTGRNILGKSSRLLATIDVAEQPKFRVQYQKMFGKDKEWWWRSDLMYEFLKEGVYLEGNYVDKMKYNYLEYDNQINRNIVSFRSYVGLGLSYEHTTMKPDKNPEFSENLFSLNKYMFNNVEVYAHFIYDSFNTVFYPTEGIYIRGSIGRSFFNDVEVDYYDDNLADVKGATNDFTRINFDFETRIPFNKNISGIIGANANFIFEDKLKTNDVSFTDYGFAEKYFLGGNLTNSRRKSYSYAGLKDSELNVNQFMRLNLAIQFSPVKKLYITPHYDLSSVGFGDFNEYIKDAFSPNGNWTEKFETSTLMSAGATLSYHSFLGPVDFDVSWVNDIDKVRLFFSVGLKFN